MICQEALTLNMQLAIYMYIKYMIIKHKKCLPSDFHYHHHFCTMRYIFQSTQTCITSLDHHKGCVKWGKYALLKIKILRHRTNLPKIIFQVNF